MKSQCKHQGDAHQSEVTGESPRHRDGTLEIGALLRRGWVRAVLAGALVLALVPVAAQAQTQQRVAWANALHTSTVRVTVGKTEDVRTDQNLVDISVGDPNDYASVDASNEAGNLEAGPFGESRGGLMQSFNWSGHGKYRLHVQLGAGNLELQGR